MLLKSLPRIGLGLAALGRPGYINLDRTGQISTSERSQEAMQALALRRHCWARRRKRLTASSLSAESRHLPSRLGCHGRSEDALSTPPTGRWTEHGNACASCTVKPLAPAPRRSAAASFRSAKVAGERGARAALG